MRTRIRSRIITYAEILRPLSHMFYEYASRLDSAVIHHTRLSLASILYHGKNTCAGRGLYFTFPPPLFRGHVK